MHRARSSPTRFPPVTARAEFGDSLHHAKDQGLKEACIHSSGSSKEFAYRGTESRTVVGAVMAGAAEDDFLLGAAPGGEQPFAVRRRNDLVALRDEAEQRLA